MGEVQESEANKKKNKKSYRLTDQAGRNEFDTPANNEQPGTTAMNHLMIDIETLGTNSDAPVLSIGAAFFDPDTSEVKAAFHEKIEFESACEGRELCPHTVKWWLEQSKEAQDALMKGKRLKQADALASFVFWIVAHSGEMEKIRPWGNGATFDISILESLLLANDIKVPWKYYNVRDVRTIVDCAKPLIKRDSIPFEGVKHDALADALHQVKYVSAMWQALRKAA